MHQMRISEFNSYSGVLSQKYKTLWTGENFFLQSTTIKSS